MRITLSLALLVGLTTVSAAQHSKVQPSQASPQKAEKAVTVRSSANSPQADANCAPGTLTVITNLPSSGGGWSATYTFTIYVTGGSPILQSNVSWIAPANSQTTCSPNPEPLNTLITCTTPYTVAANTGPTRSGTLSVSFGSSGTLSQNVLQYGPTQTLTVGVTGSGKVTSSPSGISCPGTCSVGFTYGTTVTLTASASTGHTFSGWSGPCSGTGACNVTMNSAQNVTATFTAIPETLAVSVGGSGTVISSPAGISCPGICATSFSYGTVVYLTATPSSGYVFSGWSGACSGTGTCTLTMNGAKSVTATFTQLETLTVSVSGSGTVTSSPSGISCPGTCSKSFTYGTVVALTASASTGYSFSGWSGACSGTGACSVTMNGAQSVTATFTPILVTLIVNLSGSGTVTSSPSGISCPGTCSALFNAGTTVNLYAAPSSGSLFAGWGGATRGPGSCFGTGGWPVPLANLLWNTP